MARLSADGGTLLYGTYLGGSEIDFVFALAVDNADRATVVGQTASTKLPRHPRRLRHQLQWRRVRCLRRASEQPTAARWSTAPSWVAARTSIAYAVAVDSAGRATVAGQTRSSDFPTTPGAFDTQLRRQQRCLRDPIERRWQHADLQHLSGRQLCRQRQCCGRRLRPDGRQLPAPPAPPTSPPPPALSTSAL